MKIIFKIYNNFLSRFLIKRILYRKIILNIKEKQKKEKKNYFPIYAFKGKKEDILFVKKEFLPAKRKRKRNENNEKKRKNHATLKIRFKLTGERLRRVSTAKVYKCTWLSKSVSRRN